MKSIITILSILLMMNTCYGYNVSMNHNTPDADVTYNMTIISPYALLNGTPEILNYTIFIDDNECPYYKENTNMTVSFYTNKRMASGNHDVLILYTFRPDIMPGAYNYSLSIYGQPIQHHSSASSGSSSRSSRTSTTHIRVIPSNDGFDYDSIPKEETPEVEIKDEPKEEVQDDYKEEEPEVTPPIDEPAIVPEEQFPKTAVAGGLLLGVLLATLIKKKK